MRILLTAFMVVLTPMAGAGDSAWRLGAAVGYGERGNPLIQADDVPVVVDIDIAWFGEHVFFDNGDLGLTVRDTAASTTSLVLRVRSDRVFFGRAETRLVNVSATGLPLGEEAALEVPDRDFAIEAGVEWLADGDWGFLQINAFHDVGGVHDGFELAADYGIGFARGRWYVEPGVRLAFKSADLNDYYWGVRPVEASTALPAYTAGAGINLGARLRVSYHFSRQWAMQLSVDVERLNDEIARSPIVARDHVVGFFGGISYGF